MTTNAKYVFEGETSSMERAYKTGNKLVEDLIRTVASMTPAYTAADRAADELLKRNAQLERAGNKLKASLVTPQQEYAEAIRTATYLLNQEEISEGQYALAVEKAKEELDKKDEKLQQVLATAARIKQQAVTPEEQHRDAVAQAKKALDQKLITQKEFDQELARQNQILRESKATQAEFLNSGRQGLQQMNVSARDVVATVTAMVGAYGLVQKAVSGVIAENHRLGQSITDTFRKLDQEELKLQIQAGFTPQQAQAQMPNIEKGLLKTPSTGVAGAIQLQTQLASSGFRKADVDSGDALQTVLDIKAATNQFGESMGDEKEAVLALSMYLKGLGNKAPTSGNIKDLGKQLVALFATSDIQFTDLKQLAPNAGTLKGFGLDDKEQLAGFSTLVDVMGGEKAATGLRNVVTRMATAAKSQERTDALKELGLKPTDVDISSAKDGEKFIPTLEKMSRALKGKKTEDANRILAQLFGDEGQAAASELFNPEKIDLLKQRIVEQADNTAFDMGVKSFQESAYADRQRRQVRTDLKLRKAGLNQKGVGFKDVTEIGQEAAAGAAAEGGNLSAPVGVGQAFFGAGEAAGLTPEQTAQWIQFVVGRQKRSWGGFFTGQSAAPALTFGRDTPPALPLPQAAGNRGDDPAEAVKGLTEEIKGLRADVRANSADLRTNSAETKANTAKPAPSNKRPANAPPKTPASAALASSGGR